jgi:hypothetical protein
VDYKKLAEELGGRAEPQSGTETPAIDYKALAEQYGGVQKEEEQPLAEPVATGKPASVIPQLPVTPTESTVPEDEGFFDRNYRYAKDALISGFENLRASSKGTAFAVAREYIQSFEREYGGPGVPLAPPDVKKEYEKYRAEAGEFAQDIAQFQKEAQERQLASPLRPETARLKAAMGDDLTFMESAKEAGAALISNPVGVIADLGTESFPNMAYMVATSLLARLGLKSPTAAAVAGGASSAISQFGNEYVGRLQKGESHDEAWKNAAIRSGVIGTFDAVSLKTAGKSAGKIVEALKTGKPATVAAKEFAKEMGTQAGLGAAGEAVGSLAIGEIPNPAAVMAEAAGELVTGPFEAVGTYKRVKGLAAPEDKLMADLDEAAAVEEANLAAAAAAQEDAEEGVTDFGQTDTQMGKPVTGQREPSISTLGQPGVLPTDAGAGRIEPTGLDDLSGAPQVIGRREEPVGGALAPAVNPEDTFIIRDIAGTGNEGLVNYFRTYYGLKPESMPKAASIAMPLLQRADQLLARYSEAMLKSNQPHLDEPVGSMSRLGMAKVTMLPEYQEASRLAPGGLANRLVQKAMALDKGYKRANQSQFDGAVKEMQVALDEFEQALGTLPPPISDAEKQTLRQTFKDGVASSVPKVPKEQQVAASLNLLKKGLYSPSMLTDQLDAMVATGKVSYEELDKFEDAKAQKDLKDLQEGKITQATYDARQAKTDAYFKSRMGAPTTPTEPTAPQVRSFVDLTPEQQKGYNAELKPYADKVKAAQKQFTEEQKAKGVSFANAFATWQDMPHPSKDEFVAAAKDLDAKYGIRQYGEASTPATQEGPKFAEEEFGERQGKLKSDEEQMLRIFSGSMYGAGIQDVAVKELLQNAFDSVKEAVYKGVLKGPGKIDIILNDQDRTITVTDNGIGMTTQIVDDGFFTVGGTKKDVPPELRSGGYGIAKVAFMTSTAELSLDTVRDGVRNIVAGATPVQIRNGDFVIKTERASKDEHGTTVVVKIPETYIDRNGKENNVYFIIDPNYITPLKRSLVGPVEVNFTGIDAFGDIETQVLPIGKNFDDKKTPFLTKVNFDWGTADIYYGVERKNAEYGDDAPKHEVLSSGVYQFNGTGGYSSAFNINLNEKIPYDIVVNIKPSVPASDPSYPFTPEREKFRESHKEDIAALTGYLAQIARGTEAEGLQDVFKDIISMPKVAVGGVNKDVEGKLRKLFNKGGHKTAAKAFVAPKEINVTKGLVKDTKGVVLVDTTKKSERAIEKSFEADKAAPKMEQFMNEMTQDPRQPIFHNNTNVNFIEIGEKYGDPQAFFAELGSLFVDMKEAIADGMYAYAKLKAPNLWFTGISVDKGYGGVSILVPFKGNLINPFYTQFGEKTLSGVRERMLDTMIHELAHSDARSHGQPHNTEMIKIKLFLTDNGKYDIYRDKLLELLVKHESTFSAMKEAYDRSTTKNTAKSLEQYEKTSASRAIGSDAGISEDQPGAVSAGERPTRRSDIFSPSGADTGVPIGTRVIGESEITDVETKALQLSLKIGDVHPTIVEAISNNDLNGALRIASQKLSGFSAELAKQLLSLNLPTNISFNTGRDLVRRSIDFRTANQQKRLFDYVRRNYESLYNKYFTNYDISGAIRLIEQMVAARLKKLNTAGEIIENWTKAQAKKPKQSELLSKVMLESTIRGIDPSDPKAVLNAPLQAAWNGLDKEFKDIYVAVKKYYENSVNEMVKEMKRRALGLPKAERQAMIKKINSQFGPDKLTKPYFPLRRFGQYWFQVGKGNFKEFYEFESILDRELSMRKRQAKLSRGNAQQRALAQTIRKGNGLSELYSQNITTTQVLREAQELINNLTANDVPTLKTEMQDSLNQLIYLLLPQSSMRKMFINRKAIQGASGDMLRVFATNAVHSAYQQSRFKYAEPFLNNLNKAREYVDEFASTDRAAVYRDYIEEVEKRSKTILSNEDTSLAAKAAGKASELTFYFMLTAPFTAMLNILGFAQITMPYIGGRYGYTKANAVILKNMYRYLATSPKRTFVPLATGRVMQMQFPSIVEGGKLTGRLKDAADRFVEEGQINISITNDIFGLGDRPSELYTGRYNALKRAVAALFHQSERLNREVGLLSTFELAYERYKKEPRKDLRGVIERDAQGNPVMNTDNEAFEKAIVDAKDIVSLSLGDFTRQMKPRFFTPPLLSVLTKFKQYPVLATYAVFRNFYLTFGAPFRKAEIKEFRNLLTNQGLSQSEVDRRVEEADTQRKELYREGRRRLAGMLGVTFLLGGVEAMPFFTLGIGTIVKMFADEDDDEFFDWENWFRNYMETELGGAAEDLFAKMGMNPEEAFAWGETTAEAIGRGPASAITGGSLSERVSLDPKNLWWRDGRTGSTTRENVIEDVIANSGPVVGLGFNWIDAIDLFNEGKYQRAFEKAAPAIVSKPVAAARIEEEGPRTRSGVLQTDNFSAWELAMQAVGLQPERLAQAQKSSIEAKRYEQSVLNKRNALLDRLWLERGNSDNFNEILQEAMKFSVRHPNIAITPEVIQDSFERRTKGAAEADAIGGKFDKRMLPEVLQMMRYGK